MKRPLCECQNGMVGTQFCQVHGDEALNTQERNHGCWYCQKTHEPMLFCWEFDTWLHAGCLRAAFAVKPVHTETQIIMDELSAFLEGGTQETNPNLEEELFNTTPHVVERPDGQSVEELDYFCQCSYPTADTVTVKTGTCADCGKPVRIYNESVQETRLRRG